MTLVNKLTSYFNQNPKAAQLLLINKFSDGLTADRLQRLKHEIPTRWNSRLSEMMKYLTHKENISNVAKKLLIVAEELTQLVGDQHNILS